MPKATEKTKHLADVEDDHTPAKKRRIELYSSEESGFEYVPSHESDNSANEAADNIKLFEPLITRVNKKGSSSNVRPQARRNTHSCKLCSFTTTHKYNLVRHMWSHGVTVPRTLQCEHCPFNTIYINVLSRHLKGRARKQGVCPASKARKPRTSTKIVEQSSGEEDLPLQTEDTCDPIKKTVRCWREGAMADAEDDIHDISLKYGEDDQSLLSIASSKPNNDATNDLIRRYRTIPTLRQFNCKYDAERKRLDQAILDLETRRKDVLQDMFTMWAYAKDNLLKVDSRGLNVRRKAAGSRPQKQCPIYGCVSAPINLPRHLHRVHGVEDAQLILKKVDNIEKSQLELDEGQLSNTFLQYNPKKNSAKQLYECPLCSTVLARMDQHLQRIHLLKADSQEYRRFYASKIPAILEPTNKTASDDNNDENVLVLSTNDSKKEFLVDFQKFLISNTILHQSTISKHIHQVNLVLNAYIKNEAVVVDAKLVETSFLDAISDSGILAPGKKEWRSQYRCTVVGAMKRACDFMNSKKEGSIHLSKKRATLLNDRLSLFIKKLAKEKIERIDSRWQMSKDLLTGEEINMILNSSYVAEIIDMAIKKLKNPDDIGLASQDVLKLRNVLMTVVAIKNIRRSLELCEFTLGEFHDMYIEDNTYVIHVKPHKTARLGPANFFISQREAEALTSYVKHFRIKVADCSKNTCKVFISKPTRKTTCCSTLLLSNISKYMTSVAKHSGFTSRRIGSRLLRQSSLTMMYRHHKDPSFLTMPAEQSSHSASTAEAYYDLSAKVKEGIAVTSMLMKAMATVQEPSLKDAAPIPPLLEEAAPCVDDDCLNVTDLYHPPSLDESPSSMKIKRGEKPADTAVTITPLQEDAHPCEDDDDGGLKRKEDSNPQLSLDEPPSSLEETKGQECPMACSDNSLQSTLQEKLLMPPPAPVSVVSTHSSASHTDGDTASSSTMKSDLTVNIDSDLTYSSDSSSAVELNIGKAALPSLPTFYSDVRMIRKKLKHTKSGMRWTDIRKELITINDNYLPLSIKQIKNKYKYLQCVPHDSVSH